MTHDPRTKEEIYQSMKSSLSGKIAKLTNFTERSFNYVWSQAFAEEVRELEVIAVVAELAGWIDYSGGPITDEDLETIGIGDKVSADEVNEHMEEQYLDELIKIIGVERLPGARATGEVTFTTQSSQTDIPSGTRVTTVPDSSGETTDFLTTEDAETANGVTTVTGVQIQAAEIGDEYNIPANTIVRLADPPIGVRSVTNPASTTGGTDREGNEDLRARAKQSVQSSSLGGTVDGIKGYIRQNIEAVGRGDIIIEEFTDPCPPYVDVIVDGGLDNDVKDAIEFSRPAGVRHNLIRPQIVQLGFDVDLDGTDIDTSTVNDDIESFLLELGIGENFYRDNIVRDIMQSDADIINIDDFGGIIERVTNEAFTYKNGTSDYDLDFTYESSNGSITVIDEGGTSYTEGSDFEVQDQTGDGWPETLVWIGTTPDDDERFFVDYDVTVYGQTSKVDAYDIDLVRDEKFVFNEAQADTFEYDINQSLYELSYVPFDSSVSLTDNSGNTYLKGTDYSLIDDSGNGFPQTIEWENNNLDGAVLDDGGTTTDLTTEANSDTADDIDLLPPSPAVDDAFYFGRNETFDDIVIDISTAGSGTWSIVWEYWDGGSWVGTPTITDDTNGFRNGGKNTVKWDVPGDWGKTDVGGITDLYWVRGRVETFSSISQQPLGERINPSPDDAEDFTVTYNQKLYETKYEHRDTPKGVIDDASGDTYDEDTEYETVDYTNDDENDAIHWLTNPTTLNDGEEFYFTYLTEGDVFFGNREKGDPGTINVNVT